MAEENIDRFYVTELATPETVDQVQHFLNWISVYEAEHRQFFGNNDFFDLPFEMQLGVMWQYIDEASVNVRGPMGYRLPVLRLMFARVIAERLSFKPTKNYKI